MLIGRIPDRAQDFRDVAAGRAGGDSDVRSTDAGVFLRQAPDVIAPLPGGWGRMGMARCDLKAADEAIVHSALKAAHALALPQAKKAAKRKPKR